MAPSKPAVDFNAIVQAERRRRKNETVAQKMFDRARGLNESGGGGGSYHRSSTGPSLASRAGHVGISKRNYSAPNKPRRSLLGANSGNLDDEWTHDLHRYNNVPAEGSNSKSGGSRMVRSNFNDRIFTTDAGTTSSSSFQNHFNIVGNAKSADGLSIRGLAGPYTVIVKNLASGTTAADIESAMAPVGGLVLSCRLVAERPRVIAEVILETKEGADNIVETFNNQSADGNILHVYHKVGPFPNANPRSSLHTRQTAVPSGPRADLIADQIEDSRSYGGSDFNKSRGRNGDRYRDYSRENVVDGSYGFSDRMDLDHHDDRGRRNGLYSDKMIGGRYGRSSRGDEARGYR